MNPRLVWNKGIAALCDHRFPDEFPSGSYLPNPLYAGASPSPDIPTDLVANPEACAFVREGATVWVRLSWLESFVRQALPLIESRFILITGDSDASSPAEAVPAARAILTSGKVIHWFAQNYDGTAPGISPVPIGIDFHSASERPVWGEEPSPPLAQERALIEARDSLPPVADRIPNLYIDFAWQGAYVTRPIPGDRSGWNRGRIVETLQRKDCVYFQSGRLSRPETWRRRGQYRFVASPHGNGLDCHRTWEALALGHIVLVSSSPLDPLYEGLPVVPIRDWNSVTRDTLRDWSDYFATTPSCNQKLTSTYWISHFKLVKQLIS